MLRLRDLPLLIAIVATLFFAQSAVAAPVGSAFSYQGQLTDSGAPANGTYDVKFALYTSDSGGMAIDTINVNQLAVHEGLVNSAIDFTDVPYNGQALWIEVRVRQSGTSDDYTTLSPRQALTATPYALYALNAAVNSTTTNASVARLQPHAAQPQDSSSWTLPYTGTTSTNEGSPAAAFSIVESGGGFAIYGQATSASGVRGVSSNANGVRGDSNAASGVYGFYQSGSGYAPVIHAGVVGDSPVNGVYGQSSATSFTNGAALTGVDTNGGPGLYSYVNAPSGTSIVATNDSANDGGDIFEGWHKGGINFRVTSQGFMSANGGVYGQSSSGDGIHGVSSSSNGVEGNSTTGYGVTGSGPGGGVHGIASGTANGVFGDAYNSTGAGLVGTGNHQDLCGPALPDEVCPGIPANKSYAILTTGDAILNGRLNVYGISSQGNIVANGLSITGEKNFVAPHPTDPSKEIVYTSLEGPEAGTYFRGTGKLVDGQATIEVPEDFRLVTSADNITVQLTPVGDLAILAVMSQNLNQIVVRGSQDVTFHYMVNGVRAGFENHKTIVANSIFVPRNENDDMAKHLPAEAQRRMKANGTLNADGSVNIKTAHRLGWDQSATWNAQPLKPPVPTQSSQ